MRALLTHCKRGHEFTEENTRVDYKSGVRICRACCRARGEVHRKRYKEEGRIYPSHSSEYKRKDRLKLLGWTPEEFYKVWEEQLGKCAICLKSLNFSLVQNSARACADHKHVEPPRPRGILCTNCNVMLGQAQDNLNTLRAAIVYLEKFC